MPTNMPNSLDTFNDPASTSQLSDSSVLHSGEHSNLNHAVAALEQINVGPPYLNMKGLGAGTGGTDDAALFSSAITQLTTNGEGILYLPPGSYNISSFPTFNNGNISLVGAGSELVTINHIGTADLINVRIASGKTTLKISGVTINSTNPSTTANAIEWNDTSGGILSDIVINNYFSLSNKAIWINNKTTYTSGLIIKDVFVNNCANGLVFDVNGGTAIWRDINVNNYHFYLSAPSTVAQNAVVIQGNGQLLHSSISARGVTAASSGSSVLNTVLNITGTSSIFDSQLLIQSAIIAGNYAPHGVTVATQASIKAFGIVSLNTNSGMTFNNTYSGAANIIFSGLWDVATIPAIVAAALPIGTSGSSPISTPAVGNEYYQTDTGKTVIWNGSAWISPNASGNTITGATLAGTTTFSGPIHLGATNGISGNGGIISGVDLNLNNTIYTNFSAGNLNCTGQITAGNALVSSGSLTVNGAFNFTNGGGGTISGGLNVGSVSSTGTVTATNMVSGNGQFIAYSPSLTTGSPIVLWSQGFPMLQLSYDTGVNSTNWFMPRGVHGGSGDFTLEINSANQQIFASANGSSLKLKENIIGLQEHNLTALKNPLWDMRAVRYRYKKDYYYNTKTNLDDMPEVPYEYGFVAEELNDVHEELGVKNTDGEITNYKIKSVLAFAVDAIQYLKSELDKTQKELKDLKGQ